jgi:hypothetical protein
VCVRWRGIHCRAGVARLHDNKHLKKIVEPRP